MKHDLTVPLNVEENKKLLMESFECLHIKTMLTDPGLLLNPEMFETIKCLLITCGIKIVLDEMG